jgi:tetratricopeptide (TPR) repeat protein
VLAWSSRTAELHDRDFWATAALLEELVGLRRDPDAWRRLADCYLVLGQPEKALKALQQALAIEPHNDATHAALAQLYRQRGDLKRADEHLEKARWLSEHGRD